MPFVTANFINIYYEIHGSGAPLILISGLGGDRNFWQQTIPVLSQHFQVIVFDIRGGGKTEAPAASYSMDLFATDLAGLMDALGIPKAHVLGFSMGGQIAMTFALKYPSRVLKMILAASCTTLNTQVRLFVDAVLSVYEDGASPKQMFELIAPWLFSVKFLSDPANINYLQFDEQDPELQPLYAWKNQYLAQRECNLTTQMGNINSPVLVLCGDEDVFSNPFDNAVLAKQIPGAKLEVIPGAGHLFNYEVPDTFHHHILSFLGN